MCTIDVITVIKLSCSTIRITSERVNIAYLNHVLTRCSFKFRNNLIIFVYHKQFEVRLVFYFLIQTSLGEVMVITGGVAELLRVPMVLVS